MATSYKQYKEMEIQITKDDVDYALGPSPWDLGNQALYSLCQDYPRHDRDDAIIAKIWLIGRSYAAAIERRKNSKDTSDEFYERTVATEIKKSELDDWLTALPARIIDSWCELGSVITLHGRLMDLFSKITELNKRSLASKYLHFHRPDLFFIFDSRAKAAIAKVTPHLNQIRAVSAENADSEYHAFCRRCQWLKESIKERFDRDVNPRQLDKILLKITDKTRKA